MTKFYVKEGYPGRYSWDGQNWEYCIYRAMSGITPETSIPEVFKHFGDSHHYQIAIDAGGEVVGQEKCGYGGYDKIVAVDYRLLSMYTDKLKFEFSPQFGMMQTSRGNWVLADDWDEIEEKN